MEECRRACGGRGADECGGRVGGARSLRCGHRSEGRGKGVAVGVWRGGIRVEGRWSVFWGVAWVGGEGGSVERFLGCRVGRLGNVGVGREVRGKRCGSVWAVVRGRDGVALAGSASVRTTLTTPRSVPVARTQADPDTSALLAGRYVWAVPERNDRHRGGSPFWDFASVGAPTRSPGRPCLVARPRVRQGGRAIPSRSSAWRPGRASWR